MIKRIFKLLFSLIITCNIFAQVRSSQFYSNPLLYNPASTGRFDKSSRLGLLFRSEISAQRKDFKQSILFFDSKIFSSKLPENDCFAFGIVGMSESGISEGIKNSYLSLSLGYQKSLDEDGTHQLGMGFQNTFVRKTVTQPDLTFESDLLLLSNYGYTNINPFQIQNIDFSFNDINAGLIFQGAINSKTLYTLGIAVQHITAPKIMIIGGEFVLPRQIFSNISFQKEFENNNKLYASLLVGISDQKVNEFISGLTYSKEFSKNKSILFGGWYRRNQVTGNSLIPNLGLSFKDFTINFSYDIKVSSVLRQSGSSEASLKYTFAKTRNQFLEKRFVLF